MIDNKTLDVAIAASVDKLQSLFGSAPEVAVVLGSGWAGRRQDRRAARHLPARPCSHV
jgi:purine-nucleoside phosphorylase/xanthosine phosphorylase